MLDWHCDSIGFGWDTLCNPIHTKYITIERKPNSEPFDPARTFVNMPDVTPKPARTCPELPVPARSCSKLPAAARKIPEVASSCAEVSGRFRTVSGRCRKSSAGFLPSSRLRGLLTNFVKRCPGVTVQGEPAGRHGAGNDGAAAGGDARPAA